jgi:hypothetical protein
MAIEDYIPKTSGLFKNLGDFELPSGGSLPDLSLPSGIGDFAQNLPSNPLCDENLFKDIDGILSLGSLPSIPNLESVLSNQISDVPVPNPDVMFSGVPEFTGLVDLPGLPEVDLDCVEGLFKDAANALLREIGIENPLSDLCGQLGGGLGDLGDAVQGIKNAVPEIPGINIPDVPCVGGGDLGLPNINPSSIDIPDISDLI